MKSHQFYQEVKAIVSHRLIHAYKPQTLNLQNILEGKRSNSNFDLTGYKNDLSQALEAIISIEHVSYEVKMIDYRLVVAQYKAELELVLHQYAPESIDPINEKIIKSLVKNLIKFRSEMIEHNINNDKSNSLLRGKFKDLMDANNYIKTLHHKPVLNLTNDLIVTYQKLLHPSVRDMYLDDDKVILQTINFDELPTKNL